jgi:hypothetical protein
MRDASLGDLLFFFFRKSAPTFKGQAVFSNSLSHISKRVKRILGETLPQLPVINVHALHKSELTFVRRVIFSTN